MLTNKIFLCASCALIYAMTGTAAAAGNSSQTLADATTAVAEKLAVTVYNPLETDRKDAPVVIRLHETKGIKGEVRSAIVRLDGRETPCQLDDFDQDGRADELVFLADIGGKQRLTYDITLSPADTQHAYEPRVYADMAIYDKKDKHPIITSIEAPGASNIYSDLYHHGAAFESELTAYRVYFDKRQNIDLYGKQTRQLEIAKTGFYSTPQLVEQGYGNDVLWAGASISCGAFKGWNGTATVDIESVKTRGQRVIAAGPLRTVVEVKDQEWDCDKDCMGKTGSKTSLVQHYIMYAGHRDCEVEIRFEGEEEHMRFCTGVQKVGQSPEGRCGDDGLAMSWGTDYPEYGKKDQFPPEAIGLAVYVPQEYRTETIENDLNYMYTVRPDKSHKLRYHISFCAAKEHEGYSSAAEWFESLQSWKEDLDNPLTVSVKAR